ncbi:unnamed protein product [Schistosoma intercalatum]|nr:unnamed protein product [Schistosoma intercalatum]
MQVDFILKFFIYISLLLNTYIIKSIPIHEPNVFYVNDDTNEGQRIGRITHFNNNNNNNQPINFKTDHFKAVIVRGNRPPAIYFRLDENTGDLYTRTIIDREVLCLKQYQINKNLNNIQTNLNIDYSQINYQYRSILSSNSKIIDQCKFTFQIALHRRFISQQLKNDHTIESNYPYLPEFIDIHIIIIDRNDHIPTFQPHSMINLSIPESVPIGTRIQLPLAYDPDSPEFSIQRYELYPITITDFTLYIETKDILYNTNIIQEITGLYLEVKTILDRELCDHYILEVKAYDSSSITNTMISSSINDNRNILKIYLTIEDINDNGPIFQPQTNNITQMESSTDNIPISVISSLTLIQSTNILCYKVEVIESNWIKSPILKLITKDLDSTKYSLTKYEFATNTEYMIKQLFKLNEHTGELYLKQPLDYEKHTSYTFDVLAIDSEYDRRSKLDNNLQLMNSRIQNNIFTSTANIIVNVLDINDEIPIIELDYLRIDETTGRPATFARIEENNDPPQFIADILVTDRDANALNSHVICTLVNKSNRIHNNNNNNKTDTINTSFQLTEVKRQPGLVQYNMLTVNSLDREINGAILRIKIQCTDSGEIKKTSEVDIIIHIIDVNDNSPSIQLISKNLHTIPNSNDNLIHLKENTPTGTIIAYFNITDIDYGENSRTTCKLLSIINDPLLSLNIHEYFHIDPITCNLIIQKPIDREFTYPPLNIIDLIIEIHDHGQPMHKSTINIKLKIINENDNKPLFQHKFYQFNIKENLPIGVNVGQLIITDLDGDYDQLIVKLHKQEQLPFQLWKSIIPSSSSSSSSIINQYEPNVMIYYLNTTKILDREEKSIYEFDVYANDLIIDNNQLYNQYKLSINNNNNDNHKTSTTVLVTIEDENDNDPIIIFPQQSDKIFILSNLEKKYYQLMTVNVNDKDSTSNTFIFMLEQEDYIKINNHTLKNSQSNEIDIDHTKSLDPINQLPINSFLDIDRSLGNIYLNRDLQQNDTGTYIYYIIVHDSIINPRTASLRFIVKIESIPLYTNQLKSNYLLKNQYNENIIMNTKYIETNDDYTTYYSTNKKLNNSSNLLLSASSPSSILYSSSSKQLTHRLTNDTILILSLGLILLILLATLCLIIFARHWSSNSTIQHHSIITSDKIQCSKLFCLNTSNHKQLTNNNNNNMKMDKIEVMSILQPTHSHSYSHSPNTQNTCSPTNCNINNNDNNMRIDKNEVMSILQSTHSHSHSYPYSPNTQNTCSPINRNNNNTIQSFNTINTHLNDSYKQKTIDTDNIYYHDYKQFTLLPIITSSYNSMNELYPIDDYTTLQTMNTCKCYTPSSIKSTTYNINHNFNDSIIIQPIKHNTLQFNQLTTTNNNNNYNNSNNNDPIAYYTSLSPKLKSDHFIEKRKVRIMSMDENTDNEIEKNSPSEYLTT